MPSVIECMVSFLLVVVGAWEKAGVVDVFCGRLPKRVGFVTSVVVVVEIKSVSSSSYKSSRRSPSKSAKSSIFIGERPAFLGGGSFIFVEDLVNS